MKSSQVLKKKGYSQKSIDDIKFSSGSLSFSPGRRTDYFGLFTCDYEIQALMGRFDSIVRSNFEPDDSIFGNFPCFKTNIKEKDYNRCLFSFLKETSRLCEKEIQCEVELIRSNFRPRYRVIKGKMVFLNRM